MITHEQYIRTIAAHVIQSAPVDDRERIERARILYGAGNPGLRGVTYFDRWESANGNHIDLVEICALGESSPVQVAGTVIHELAHVAAGHGAGHGKGWRAACDRIGLRLAKAAGMRYLPANLRPDIRKLIASVIPADGKPNGVDLLTGLPTNPFTGTPVKPRPCPMGIGTRGGKSRGTGSGSRLRKWECDCGVKIRVASDNFRAHCDNCGSAFKQDS